MNIFPKIVFDPIHWDVHWRVIKPVWHLQMVQQMPMCLDVKLQIRQIVGCVDFISLTSGHVSRLRDQNDMVKHVCEWHQLCTRSSKFLVVFCLHSLSDFPEQLLHNWVFPFCSNFHGLVGIEELSRAHNHFLGNLAWHDVQSLAMHMQLDM